MIADEEKQQLGFRSLIDAGNEHGSRGLCSRFYFANCLPTEKGFDT